MTEARRTVGAVLAAAVASSPEAPAVTSAGQSVSYAELLRRGERCAARLGSLGLAKGDRVVLMLGNDLTMVDFWLGCSLSGVVEVPVNPDFRGEMLRYILADSGAKVAIVAAERLAQLAEALGSGDAVEKVVVAPGEGDAPAAAPAGVETVALADLDDSDASILAAAEIAERDAVGVLYTSGTTGPAKGTLITHRHSFEYANACTEMLALRPEDVYFAPLPLFHIAGQWAVLYAGLIAGATVALTARFSVTDFWEDCDREGATVTFLLGAMAQFLARQDPAAEDSGHSLERILMVPLVDELDEFRRRFGVEVTTCYGSTETGVPLVADFGVAEATVAGRPRDGYELRLLGADDEEVAPGEVGELCLRHREPWVTMTEYVGKPEATAAALRNQWLHSGDALRLDADGVYHFVDRMGDTLRRRGENISSFEVERELYAHQSVLECAAVGIPSPHTEEDLVVVVVPKEGHRVEAEELRAFMAERAPRFMVPDQVEIREEMPKTETGKIQKSVLRAQLSSGWDPVETASPVLEQHGKHNRETI
jgi:crotonobetaine/carnitine-CoA ligase